MKKIFIVFVVIFLAAAAALAFFVATFNPNKYRPLIIEKASEALGTPVELGSISLGWRNGLALRVRDVVIHADAAKSSAAAKLKEASATLDLGAFLRKQVRVSSIVLIGPQAHLVKAPDGKVGLKGVKLPAPGASPAQPPSSSPGAGLPVDMESFSIGLFQVRDGFVWFEDPAASPPMSIQVKDIDADVKRFSLREPFSFVARASVFSPAQNMQAEGTVTLPYAGRAGLVEDGVFKTDLGQLDLAELGRAFPAASSAGIQEMKGTLLTKLDRFEIGGAGRAKAELSLEDGRVKTAASKGAFDKLQLKAVLNGDDLRVDNFSSDYAGGKLKASGIVKQFRTQALSGFSLRASDLAMDQLMPDTGRGGPRLSGRLSMDIEGQAAGTGWPQISRTLAGQGKVTLKDGVLLNYNLLRTVVQKLSMVPGAEQMLRDNLPNIYKAKMNEPSTILQPVEVPFAIQNGQVYFSRLDLVTDFIIVHGAGQIGLDKRMSMKTTLRMHQQLSQTIVSLVPQAQMLTNQQGELEVPGLLQGTLPHVTFVPDPDYMMQKLLSSEAVQKTIQGFIKDPEAGVKQVGNLLDKPMAAGESGFENLLKQALSGSSGQTTASGTGTQNQ